MKTMYSVRHRGDKVMVSDSPRAVAIKVASLGKCTVKALIEVPMLRASKMYMPYTYKTKVFNMDGTNKSIADLMAIIVSDMAK